MPPKFHKDICVQILANTDAPYINNGIDNFEGAFRISNIIFLKDMIHIFLRDVVPG